jgi:pimeloyl-ACP methyl ester carboxylesterase
VRAGIATGLLVTLVLFVSAPAAAAPTAAALHGRGAAPPALAEASGPGLSACPFGSILRGFDCGHIRVPFERADPSLGTTRVGFAVRPRDDGSRPSQGTIFAIEGGPGYSSTGSAKYYTRLFRDLLRRRELVLVDSRGTGISDALRCGDSQKFKVPQKAVVSRCAAQLGPRFFSYRTQAAAEDLEAVRQALGLGDILLYGDSYGSFLAQTYAYRHGDHIRRMVLDGSYLVAGESPWYVSSPRTGMRALSLACSRSPGCPRGSRHRLIRAVAKMRRSGDDVTPLANEIWSAGSYGAPQTYVAIDRALRRYLAGGPNPFPGGFEKSGNGGLRAFSRAMEVVFSCNDYPLIWKKEAPLADRRQQLKRAIRDYPPRRFFPFTAGEISSSTFTGYLYCLNAPAPGPLYEPPRPPGVKHGPRLPTLVISGEMDDVTTAREGRDVSRQFPGSRFVIVPNAGHVQAVYHPRSGAARTVRKFIGRP